MIKKILSTAILCAMLPMAMHSEDSVATFDFSDPTTLTPSLETPAQKEFILLDGKTFTSGDVSITFQATGTGNTKVRLYRPYDIEGCDVRLYDGDTLIVKSENDEMCISDIQFTMSLSGAASGSNDINFIPSSGDFIWEDECWIPDEGVIGEKEIELVSALQSRLASMTVTLVAASTDVKTHGHEQRVEYYNLQGIKVERPVQGVYIKRTPEESNIVLM